MSYGLLTNIFGTDQYFGDGNHQIAATSSRYSWLRLLRHSWKWMTKDQIIIHMYGFAWRTQLLLVVSAMGV